ncbi:MAG: hypothetical protein IIV60_02230 [Alistipes sp.]|nr:hypothetical protein [Alistipes sp.]
MNTLYLFPTIEESVAFCDLRPELREQVVVVGVGMAEAGANAAALIARHRPRRVVLCGIAGACDSRVEVGAVVQVESDRVAGLPEKYSIEYSSSFLEGLCRVQSLTVNRTGESLPIVAGNLPCIEQMEGAAVAAVCRAMGVEEYYHLRAISNYVDDDRSAWRIKEAVEALGEKVVALNL